MCDIIVFQGGSAGDDECSAIAGGLNDTLVLAGGTGGNWSAHNAGDTGFAAVGAYASFITGAPDVASPNYPRAEEYDHHEHVKEMLLFCSSFFLLRYAACFVAVQGHHATTCDTKGET